MIKVKYLRSEQKKCSCDNCDREMPVLLQFTFHNKQGNEYNRITLCEDCCHGMERIYDASMVTEYDYKYENGEVSEVTE